MKAKQGTYFQREKEKNMQCLVQTIEKIRSKLQKNL